MKRYGVVLAFSALVVAATAYPGLNPDVSEQDSNVDPVDIAIRQQSAEFLNVIYAIAGQPQPDGSSEVIEELIAASLPESIRQDVVDELEAGGDAELSEELKERINLHILEWSLQYVPEDLQEDLTAALEEYRSTGQVSGDNDQLVERVREYVASLESGPNKRGFWSGLAIVVGKYIIGWIINRWG